MVIEKKKKFPKRWLALIVALLFVHFFQLPYYYSEPGDAKVLAAVIDVKDGYEDQDDGSFMLTTIKMGKANLFFYIWSQFSEFRELYPEEQIRYQGESEADYQHRQLMLMSSSQETAAIVAYEHAGKEVDYDYFGVLVTQLIEGMPASEVLEPGDHIVAVDGERVLKVEEFFEAIEGKGAEDEVVLTISREEETLEVTVGFAPFPKEMGVDAERVGLGISYPVTDREVTFHPDVTVDTSEIGGPSAGLMFSLEIYNQLLKEDITKGYQIAGTGTIDDEGRVGRIGGAKQKVVAANNAGADYFFVPNEQGNPDSNYQEALATAKKLNIDMEIIPVDTFEDAIAFLESLPQKSS
ncbi:SepM family pheromone-processing serine protease [Halalkalibacterium ligniniphilum]|uniref:SepM family pheromone-processing serine protease n=1 Tax=Halalkalibacterium ligniniphilum TaxID=1134413 RepID=UPI000344BBBA|nr:SepM family pheromone-processing serine protease [Halalkalibacterium ligniniphilum]